MSASSKIDLKRQLTSPRSEFQVEAQRRSFPTSSFNSDEAELLESQVADLMTAFDSQMMTDLISQRTDSIALTATFAKGLFEEKLFGGLNAGDNELGFDVLRPGHIRSDPADGTIQNDWYFSPETDVDGNLVSNWNDWIGDGGANNYLCSDNQVTVIYGLVDQSAYDTATQITGINVNSFGRNVDMLPKDLNDLKLGDNEREMAVTPLPTLIMQENDSVHIRLRTDEPGTFQPRLLGFTFGLGTYLNTEEY